MEPSRSTPEIPTPDGEVVSSTPTPEDSVPDAVPLNTEDKILAYHTVTTLLASLGIENRQTSMKPLNENSSNNSPTVDKYLEISSAIAILAVRCHEVIAVAIAPGSGDWTVISSINTDRDNDEQVQTIQEINDRFSPCVDFQDAEANWVAMTYVKKFWNCEQSLEVHFWMLMKLRDAGKTQFLAYILATSRDKMRRRMVHRKSRLLFRRLLDTKEDIDYHKTSSLPEPTSVSVKYDRVLAKIINAKFKLVDGYDTLKKAAMEFMAGTRKYLYSDDTLQQFYLFFLSCLKYFSETLETLCKLKPRSKKDSAKGKMVYHEEDYTPIVDRNADNNNLNEITSLCTAILALQAFVRGSALKAYLLANETRLEMTLLPPNPVSQYGDNDDDPEVDLVFLDLKNNKTTVSEAYIQWLKLILVQADAIDIFLHICKVEKPRNVVTHFIFPPSFNRTLMPWKDLLDRHKVAVFGEDQESVTEKFGCIQAAVDSLTLESSEQMNSNSPKLRWSRLALESIVSRIVENWAQITQKDSIPQTEILVNITVQSAVMMDISTDVGKLLSIIRENHAKFTDLSHYVATVHTVAETLQDITTSPPPVTQIKSLVEFRGGIHQLSRTLSICLSFRRCQTEIKGWPGRNVAKNTQPFSGAVHCEQTVALHMLANKDKGFEPYIGVSKPGCPGCTAFLRLLGEQEQKEVYGTRGSHSIMTASSLPLHVPIPLIDAMNQHFGTLLAAAITNFVPGAPRTRLRGNSNTSAPASLTSSHGHATNTSGGSVYEAFATGYNVAAKKSGINPDAGG